MIDDAIIGVETLGENFDADGANGKFAGALDQAKKQIAPKTEIERRACLPAFLPVVGAQNRGPENLIARAQQGVGDVARAVDQRRGVGLVWKDDREGVSGLAGLDEVLTGPVLRDRIGRRCARRSKNDDATAVDVTLAPAKLVFAVD